MQNEGGSIPARRRAYRSYSRRRTPTRSPRGTMAPEVCIRQNGGGAAGDTPRRTRTFKRSPANRLTGFEQRLQVAKHPAPATAGSSVLKLPRDQGGQLRRPLEVVDDRQPGVNALGAFDFVRHASEATAASSASIVIRHVWTSRRGGSTSMTSPSTATSGEPIARISSLATPR